MNKKILLSAAVASLLSAESVDLDSITVTATKFERGSKEVHRVSP